MIWKILTLLSDFSQTTRYYNLDALSASQVNKDPLNHWNEIILMILKTDVSKYQQKKFIAQAKIISELINDFSITIMSGLDKKPLSTFDALSLPGLHELTAKYAVMRIVKLLIPLKVLTSNLSLEAYNLGCSTRPFPQMHEFLEWLSDDRQYVLGKRKWP